jgi:hypothetical protein
MKQDRTTAPRRGPPALRVAAVVAILHCFSSGCATYGFAERGPSPDDSTDAVDENAPQESTRWSFFWGVAAPSYWSPIECVEKDNTGKCVKTRDQCDGNGAGKVIFSLEWYSVPMAVLTLGMAIPSKATVYCSTQKPACSGP